jgi:hypothetical protein
MRLDWDTADSLRNLLGIVRLVCMAYNRNKPCRGVSYNEGETSTHSLYADENNLLYLLSR